MESASRNEVVRLLIEGTPLSLRAEKLLNMLIMTNPVAPRGQQTMISVAKLIDALGLSNMTYHRSYAVLDEIKWIFSELAGASWQASSRTRGSTGVFVDMHWVSGNSVFVHFQLNGKFLAILDQLGHDYAAGIQYGTQDNL